MAQGADVDIQLYPEAVTFLPYVLEWAELGILPSGMYRNRHFAEQEVAAGDTPVALQDALFSPETSGGLMIAVAADDAEALVSALRADGRVPAADIVGTIGPHLGGPRITLEKGRPWH